MEPDLEHDIRHLAYHIWHTAGRDFSQTALDFWAMAERMVIELTADSVRRANAATASAVENAAAGPRLCAPCISIACANSPATCGGPAPSSATGRWITGWPPKGIYAC